MSRRLEDYALIGDTHTAALVHRGGSIDWLCLPRFDSAACFAALLGTGEHGYWSLAPRSDTSSSGAWSSGASSSSAWSSLREYVADTLVLRTTHSGPDGVVRVVDCMPVRGDTPTVVRRVEGVSGQVRMRSDFVPRFDYGSALPWLRPDGRRMEAVAGPDRLTLDSDVPHQRHNDAGTAEFVVGRGQTVDFRLRWSKAEEPEVSGLPDVGEVLSETRRWWADWSAHCAYEGAHHDAVLRSLITLKALTYAPTGGIVAAPTMSLPEQLGGVRNWDYRFCWIRDATFTLLALLQSGYSQAARDWREWLLRAVAGRPEQMQILYGVDGTRRLPETELHWLPGYAGSRPVRTGNDAAGQFQLDAYGELMDALHQARLHGMPPEADAWRLQRQMLDFLEGHWQDADNGIWEMRGPRRQFTHSKVMAWAAADRAVATVSRLGLDGPLQRWRRLRSDIFDEVCARGYDPERNTFTQYYGSGSVDAALLMIAKVGFLPATDERVRGTVAAVERELVEDGLVRRYAMTDENESVDGLPQGEGTFLPCTFWLADNHILAGDVAKGRALFERLLELRNDVGLLAEQYDVRARRLVGNFPQALSHIPLVGTAFELASARGPSRRRAAENG